MFNPSLIPLPQNRGMTTDDDDNLTDDQIMDLPMQVMPGDLSRLWSARANIVHEREFKELILELTGGTDSHLMIRPDQDPRVKRQREEADRRRATQEMQDYEDRSNRLLVRIDEQERALVKRRQEVEDKAIKLHDGRRVYVDGNQYRDQNGNILQGSARDEADTLHRGNPQASTWQEKKDIDDRYAEAKRLRQKVLQGRDAAERGGDISAANDKLTAEEKEFQNSLETTRTEIAAKAPTDLAASYSTDYMASYGDEYTISTVPAFTKAAQQTDQQTDKQTETETAQTKLAPQPLGQGAPKLG
jgi:hypothetical protein